MSFVGGTWRDVLACGSLRRADKAVAADQRGGAAQLARVQTLHERGRAGLRRRQHAGVVAGAGRHRRLREHDHVDVPRVGDRLGDEPVVPREVACATGIGGPLDDPRGDLDPRRHTVSGNPPPATPGSASLDRCHLVLRPRTPAPAPPPRTRRRRRARPRPAGSWVRASPPAWRARGPAPAPRGHGARPRSPSPRRRARAARPRRPRHPSPPRRSTSTSPAPRSPRPPAARRGGCAGPRRCRR